METKKRHKGLKIVLAFVLGLLLIGVLYGIITQHGLRRRPDLASADDSSILEWYDAVVTEKHGQIGSVKSQGDPGRVCYGEVEDILTSLNASGRKDLMLQIIAREDQRLNGENRVYDDMFTEFLTELYGGDTAALTEDLTGAGLTSLAASYRSGADQFNDVLAEYYDKDTAADSKTELLEQQLRTNPPLPYTIEDLSRQEMEASANCAILAHDEGLNPALNPLLPRERQAQNLAEIRYVIDIGDEENAVCTYTNGATGIQRVCRVTLIDRADNSELASATVSGEQPPDTAEGSPSQVFGPYPAAADLLEAIDKMITEMDDNQ